MTSSSSRDRPLVLVVEEETTERVVLVDHLTGGGYQVLEATDSEEALSALTSRKDVRVVVTDAHIPGKVDGHQLAQLVRERWPDIVTIMTSGHSDATSGPVPDGAAFIVKPYLLERLLPTLGRLLDRTD
jgi:CheY-like chemotaxis protein